MEDPIAQALAHDNDDAHSDEAQTGEKPRERKAKPRAVETPSSRATMPGKVGRYETSKLLGEGAMGRVFLATDPELGRQVAIKLLRLESAGNARDAYIARFRNEARAAARFQHPNVVTVHDAGVDPTLGPYLVYEYVAGQTLRARINEDRLDAKAIIVLARGIASALDAMHAAGIIHRDVKPDNILINPEGGVKITDFGIARLPDAALTRDGQFLGTPAYAAPEAITRGVYSARGDQFSLAAVLYESMCGIRPFPGDDAVSVSYAVANETQPPPSKWVRDLPPLVDECFAKAFSKRPNDRYLSAGEFAATLSAAFRGSAQMSAVATAPLARRPQNTPKPVEARRSNAAETKPDLSRKRAFAVVAAVVLAGLAFAVARWYGGGDPAIEGRDAARPAAAAQRANAATTTTTTPANTQRPRTRTRPRQTNE